MDTDSEVQVLRAADNLVSAFGNSFFDIYFACFTDDATFILYFLPRRLESLAEWHAELEKWSRDGNRIISCTSSNRRVDLLTSDVAIFSHDVVTVERTADGQKITLDERETIVFQRQPDSRWLAVHEHLSERPSEN
jgi:ketosteroid isomerase-like protein